MGGNPFQMSPAAMQAQLKVADTIQRLNNRPPAPNPLGAFGENLLGGLTAGIYRPAPVSPGDELYANVGGGAGELLKYILAAAASEATTGTPVPGLLAAGSLGGAAREANIQQQEIEAGQRQEMSPARALSAGIFEGAGALLPVAPKGLSRGLTSGIGALGAGGLIAAQEAAGNALDPNGPQRDILGPTAMGAGIGGALGFIYGRSAKVKLPDVKLDDVPPMKLLTGGTTPSQLPGSVGQPKQLQNPRMLTGGGPQPNFIHNKPAVEVPTPAMGKATVAPESPPVVEKGRFTADALDPKSAKDVEKTLVDSGRFTPDEITVTKRGKKVTVEAQEKLPDGLSEQQLADLATLKIEYETHRQNLKNKFASGEVDEVRFGKEAKGLGMQYSAEKRRLIQGSSLDSMEGGLTDIELRNLRKYRASNYRGKPVVVDGRTGKIQETPYGRVKVAFDDGDVMTVEKKKVQPFDPDDRELLGLPRDVEVTKVEADPVQGLIRAETQRVPVGADIRDNLPPQSFDFRSRVDFEQGFPVNQFPVNDEQKKVAAQLMQAIEANQKGVGQGIAVDVKTRTKSGSTSTLADTQTAAYKTFTPIRLEVSETQSATTLRAYGLNENGHEVAHIVADFTPGQSNKGHGIFEVKKSQKPARFDAGDVNDRAVQMSDDKLGQMMKSVQAVADQFPDSKPIQAAAKLLQEPTVKNINKASKLLMQLNEKEFKAAMEALEAATKRKC